MLKHIKGFSVYHELQIIEWVSQKMNMVQEAPHNFPLMSLSTCQFLKTRNLDNLLPRGKRIPSGHQLFAPYLSISFQNESAHTHTGAADTSSV